MRVAASPALLGWIPFLHIRPLVNNEFLGSLVLIEPERRVELLLSGGPDRDGKEATATTAETTAAKVGILIRLVSYSGGLTTKLSGRRNTRTLERLVASSRLYLAVNILQFGGYLRAKNLGSRYEFLAILAEHVFFLPLVSI